MLKGGYGYQSQWLTTTLQSLVASSKWSGGLVWALRDFACRPGWKGGNTLQPNPPYNNKGLFTTGNVAKPSAAVISENFKKLNNN
jgi:hypothetical protein